MGLFFSTIISWLTSTGVRVLVAIVVLIVAFKLINFFAAKLSENARFCKLDKTLRSTFLYVAKLALKIIVVISMIAYLGIDTSSITALIASFGVCIGLAVNGAVGNFAGGVLLLITRPFKVDDFVELAGTTGTVEQILLCNTKIRTLDNKIIYIPNGTAANTTVINYSEKETRRVDIDFSISYASDFALAKNLLSGIADAQAEVLKDPAAAVVVTGGDKFSTNLQARFWVKASDYWTVYSRTIEEAKKAFAANGIEVPSDQMEVRIREKANA